MIILSTCCRRLLRRLRPQSGTLYRWGSLLASLSGHSSIPSWQTQMVALCLSSGSRRSHRLLSVRPAVCARS